MGKNGMTSMERIKSVLRREIPDQVPLVLQSREFGLKYYGAKFEEAYRNPDLYVQSQLKVIKDFELDAAYDIWCTPAVDEALGAKMVIPEDDPPWIEEPCVQSPDDLNKLKTINPWKDGRMPYLLDVVAKLKKAVGPDMPVIAWASPPFRTACLIRGNTQLYMDMIDNPSFVKDLLEITTENCTAYGKALVEAGADMVCTSNPVANMDCISLDHFKEFAHPYTKRFFADIKKAGAMAINFHTCGRWDDRFDLCCENADILHVDRVDLGEFKQKYGSRIVPQGNIKAVATLFQGTPEEVRDEAKANIRDAAPGGGFIFGADCAVARDTPPQHVRILTDVIKEIGIYPELG